MPRSFKLVDVFHTQPLTGNPLAVVFDAEGLSTEEMRQITRWLNFSETTFLLPPTSREADYRVRIFTLDRNRFRKTVEATPQRIPSARGTTLLWIRNVYADKGFTGSSYGRGRRSASVADSAVDL